MPGLTKGLSFHNVSLFAHERFGDAGWEEVLTNLTVDDRVQLAGMVPIGWYELDLYARLLAACERAHGSHRPTLIEDYGRFSVERDVTKVHTFMLRLIEPGLILAQSMRLWRRFQDTGEWAVEHSAGQATGRLSDWGCVDTLLCRELIGYIEGLLSFGRAKEVRVRHAECRAQGASACVFSGRWQ